MDFSFITAFFAGVLSFFSPCVFPLIPLWLSYITGISIENFRSKAPVSSFLDYASVLWGICTFILGFSTVFVLLGLTSSLIGSLLYDWRNVMISLCGFFILCMGLHFLHLFKLSFLLKDIQFFSIKKPTTSLGGYMMGFSFAFSWTPCIGPVLGSLLALAASKDTMLEGAFLLSIYSLGFSFPLLLSGIFFSFFMRFFSSFQLFVRMTEKIVGIWLVALGLFFILRNLF